MKEVLSPRVSTTGVQTPKEMCLKALIDYVGVTFKNVQVEQVIKEILKLDISFFIDNDYGFFNYRRSYRFDNILILHNGEDDSKGMGVHVQMTGAGCRQLDCYLKTQKRKWKDFFKDCFELDPDCNFSRLDVSIDDTKVYFKIPKLLKKIKSGELVSRFKYSYGFEKLKNGDGVNVGTTIYIGSPTSDIRFRFYEKNYEQAFKQKVEVEEIGDWNRYEIQIRNENATKCASVLARSENVIYIIKSILNNYVRFVNKDINDLTHKHRWKTWRNWSKFIEDSGKLTLYIKPEPKTFEETYRWLLKQTSNSLKTIEIIDRVTGMEGKMLEDLLAAANLKDTHYEKMINYLKQMPSYSDVDKEIIKDSLYGFS